MASEENEIRPQEMNDLKNQLYLIQNDYTKLQEHLSIIELKYQSEIKQLQQCGENAYLIKLKTVVANLYNQPIYSDMLIQLENGHQLYGHKLILSARSETWGLLDFYQTQCLDLSGIQYEVAIILIKWVYTDNLDQINENLLIELLKIAGWFNVDLLKIRCEKELISLISVSNCNHLYNISVSYTCSLLKTACTDFINGTTPVKTSSNDNVGPPSDNTSNTDKPNNEGQKSEEIKNNTPEPYSAKNEATSLQEPDENESDSSMSLKQHATRKNRESKSSRKVKSAKKIQKACEKVKKSRIKTKFETSNLKCNDCHRKFTYKDAFDRHVKMHKGDNCAAEIKADVIRKLNKENNFNKYSESSEEETDNQDKFSKSQVIFPEMEDLESSEEKETEKFTCKLCPKSFPTPEKLKRHSEIHGRTRKHNCPEKDCGKSFFTRSTLKQHMLIHSNEKPYQCEVCQKHFRHSSALSVHLELHARQGQVEKTTFPCEECGLKLATTQSLQRHILNKHTDGNVKPIHQCTLCGQLFGYRGSLKAHMKKHNGEGFTQCDICGREFKDQKNLKSHLRTHSDAKPYQCPHCSYTCKHSSALLNHVRRHTGDRPHICDICGKSFISTSERKRHSLIHTGDKPFNCPICGKAFRKSHHVKQHYRTHKNEGFMELGDFGQASSLPLPDCSQIQQ